MRAEADSPFRARMRTPFATLGVAWNPCRLLVLDVGCVLALNDDVPGFQLVFGLTENLGRILD